MAAEDELGISLIGRDKRLDETHKRAIACWNFATAFRDEETNPLWDRIPLIARVINTSPIRIDALFALEAGRPSQGHSWTEMAALLEKLTNLSYVGIKLLNATGMCYGKALFIRQSTIAVKDFIQFWTTQTLSPWSGDYYGNDVVIASFYPVVQDETLDGKIATRVIRNSSVAVSAFHFPMKTDERMKVSYWMNEHLVRFASVAMGSFNTFPDDGEDVKMLEAITAGEHIQEVVTNDEITFQGFSNDLVKKPADFRDKLNAHSEVVSENEDGTINVRFASKLDRVFNIFFDNEVEKGCALFAKVLPITEASNRSCVIAIVHFQ